MSETKSSMLDKWKIQAYQYLHAQMQIWRKEARDIGIMYNWSDAEALQYIDEFDTPAWLPGSKPKPVQLEALFTGFEDWTDNHTENEFWASAVTTFGQERAHWTWWRQALKHQGKLAAQQQPDPSWVGILEGAIEPSWDKPTFNPDKAEEKGYINIPNSRTKRTGNE